MGRRFAHAAAAREHGERHRLVPVAEHVRRGDPVQRLVHRGDADALLRAGHERDVEVLAVDHLGQLGRQVGDDLELDAAVPEGEVPDHVGQQQAGVVVRRAEADRRQRLRRRGLAHQRVVEIQDLPGVAAHPLAVRGQAQLAALAALHQRPADHVLQPLDLQADRRLRAQQTLARAREAARLSDDHERAQQVDVDVHHVSSDLLKPSWSLRRPPGRATRAGAAARRPVSRFWRACSTANARLTRRGGPPPCQH